jgi:hypothetical protein
MNPIRIPPLIAGPVVRRCDRERIVVWIATRRRYRVEATLRRIDGEGDSTLDVRADARTLRLGKRLYVSLIELRPPEGDAFPERTPLGYNLTFRSRSGDEAFDLGDLGLLDPAGEDSIVYGDAGLPTLMLPGDRPAPLLHGSCRKPHGKGEDALAAADALLARAWNDLDARPGALFLMGDQIYADDVADPLLPALSSLGRRLIGASLDDEPERVEASLAEEPFAGALRRIRGRQYVAETFCRFTSGHAHNHLLRLGEYAAMYALAWSPEPWRALREAGEFRSFRERLAAGDVHTVYPDSPEYASDRAKELRRLEARYDEQLRDLERFERTLPRVRRLLANVPTYMLFDDHDVTDDWNLSAEWKDRVWDAPLGRHVVANALTAYWAFQAWGNEPEAFDDGFVDAIRARCAAPVAPGDAAYEAWARRMWRFDGWQFVAPTAPRAAFLDTRTMRSYDLDPTPVAVFRRPEEVARSPRLLHRHGLHLAATKLFESGWRPGDGLILVSPPPLYGLGLIETLLRDYAYPIRALGFPVHAALDFEAWKYNARGFLDALDWVADLAPRYCIVLSGDVHFASSVTVRAERADGRVVPFRQFTSSPLRNESFRGLVGFLLKRLIDWNAWRRKGKRILRYGAEDGRLVRDVAPVGVRWTETIRYLSTSRGSIVRFRNNVGRLRWSDAGAEQTLLVVRADGDAEALPFEPAPWEG